MKRLSGFRREPEKMMKARQVAVPIFVSFMILLVATMSFANGQKEGTQSSAAPAAATNSSMPYAGQEITVAFLGSPAPDALISKFTDSTGIKIKWVYLGWDAMQTKITAAASANTFFADITDVDWSRVGEYYKTKWFVPLNNYFDVNALKSDVPQISSFIVNGQLIGMPSDASIMLTTVNTADFQKAGITTMPTTIEEYTSDLKKLQSTGVNQTPLGIPFAAAEGLSTYWYETTGAFGGEILSKDFKPLFSDPSSAGYKAMEWMVNAYQSGLVPKGYINTTDSEEQQSGMANGQISTIFSDYSGNVGTIYNVPANSKVVGKVKYIPTPGANGVGPNLGNPDGIGILKGSTHVDAAAAFIKWFDTTEIQADISGVSGPSLSFPWALPMRLSAIKALFSNNDLQAQTMYDLFSNHSRAVFPQGAPPWYSQFSNAVYTNIHSAALGQETVAQAIAAITSTVNNLNQNP